jgi:ADP-ribosylglycohydrolase
MVREMKLADKIKGVLFGHAIGDALGVGLEGWSKKNVEDYYPQGYSSYEQMEHYRRRYWEPGEWTDDTEQMICILDSILEKKAIDIRDIALRFYNWLERDGKGSGGTVTNVIYYPDFTKDPYRASKEIWERSGKFLAANGGVMRTSILGIYSYEDEEAVIRNTETVCRITHWDPRCVGSCVAVSCVISALLRDEADVEKIFDRVLTIMEGYDHRIGPFMERAKGPIAQLNLDERKGKGYTLKALSAGFWALLQAKDFKEGILEVINQGGDTDSNGAVAGALLGARFGFIGIPEEYISGLLMKEILEEKLERLLLILGE